MLLFILATWYRDSAHLSSSNNFSPYLKEKPLCSTKDLAGVTMWYYMRYCYNELQPSTNYIFDYCECRAAQKDEKPYYVSTKTTEQLFCYNYSMRTPQLTSTPQLTRTPMKTIKPRTKKTPPKINVLLTQQLLFFSLTQ